MKLSEKILYLRKKQGMTQEQQRYSIQLPVFYRNIQPGISDSTFCGSDGGGNCALGSAEAQTKINRYVKLTILKQFSNIPSTFTGYDAINGGKLQSRGEEK